MRQYELVAIYQYMQPTLSISFELVNSDGFTVRLAAKALLDNKVVMETLSAQDQERVHYYVGLMATGDQQRAEEEKSRCVQGTDMIPAAT